MKLSDSDRLSSRRTVLRLVGGVVVGLGLSTACQASQPAAVPTSAPSAAPVAPTSAAASKSAPAANPTQAPAVVPALGPLTKIRFGTTPVRFNSAVPQLFGNAKGFYREQNIDLEVINLESDQLVLKGLLAGELDAQQTNPGAALAAIDKGGAVKVIGAYVPGLQFNVYAKKEIGSLQDLYGKTVAISSPNGFPHLLMLALFKKSNLDASRLTFVGVGADEARVQALIAGKVDATVGAFDKIPVLEKAGGFRTLVVLRDAMPDFIQDTVMASEQAIKDKAEPLVRFMVASTRSMRYILDNRDDTIQSIAPVIKADPAEISQVYDDFMRNKVYDPDGRITPEQLQLMQEINKSVGSQDAIQPFEKVADVQFQRKALEIIGPYAGTYRR